MKDKIEQAYLLVQKERELPQSELWKKLGVSIREGSRVAREMENRGLVDRTRELHGGRWTYILVPKRVGRGVSSIEDIFCLQCPYEARCSYDSSKYLIDCIYLEEWSLEQYARHHQPAESHEEQVVV